MWLCNTQITDSGCNALAAALRSGALPALDDLFLDHTPASAASKAAVTEALVSRRGWRELDRATTGMSYEEYLKRAYSE